MNHRDSLTGASAMSGTYAAVGIQPWRLLNNDGGRGPPAIFVRAREALCTHRARASPRLDSRKRPCNVARCRRKRDGKLPRDWQASFFKLLRAVISKRFVHVDQITSRNLASQFHFAVAIDISPMTSDFLTIFTRFSRSLFLRYETTYH